MTVPLPTKTYTARWVFPVAGPPLERGVLSIQGERILAVEPVGSRRADVDFGNAAMIPGLANCHTHLDLTGAWGQTPPTPASQFTDWLRSVIAFRRRRSPEQVQADIAQGLQQVLVSGTTLLGDISSGGASWAAVSAAPLRATLYWEILGLTPERYQAQLDEFGLKTGQSGDSDAPEAMFPATRHCHWATSPHAPYSANHDAARAQFFLGNVAMHFAESPAEAELLRDHSGPFVPFLQSLGVWHPEGINRQWNDFLQVFPKCMDPTRLFVHGNYLPPDFPLGPGHTLVFCPRTGAAFGHPPHPFRGFLNRGVRVVLGTDSLASNPDLDVLAEARFLHGQNPDLPGETLLKMLTIWGAEALGWRECGELAAGNSADVAVIPLADREAADPHDLLFDPEAPRSPRTVLWRGEVRGSCSAESSVV
jgi:cytosine/adenosine deaminase-related metal-dependent hydrolase